MNYEFYLVLNPGSYEEEIIIKEDMEVKIWTKDDQIIKGGVVGIRNNCLEIDSSIDNIEIEVDLIDQIIIIERKGE